jgi:hypothetical protein
MSFILDRVKREPAVLAAVFGAIFTGIGSLMTDGDLSWATAVPLVVGIVTRHFVTPANGAEADE